MLRITRTTSLFTSLVTFAEEIKDLPRDSRQSKVVMNKYNLGLVILEEMRDYWLASAWAYSLFDFLAENDFSVLRRLPRASRWQTPEPEMEDTSSVAQGTWRGDFEIPFLDIDILQHMNAFFGDSGNIDPNFFNDPTRY